MRRSELLLWADRYKTDRGNRYKAELGKRDKIHGQGFVTKSDLIWLTRWKFDGYGLVLGRRLAEAKSNPARRVEEVSKLVLVDT